MKAATLRSAVFYSCANRRKLENVQQLLRDNFRLILSAQLELFSESGKM
jgi:hypothetical protein